MGGEQNMKPRHRRPARARSVRRLVVVVLAATCLVLCAGQAAAASNPLRLVTSARLDPRVTELTFTPPALAEPTGVRVLLPDGYSSSHRRYPVLYLLHGCCNDTTRSE